MRIKCIPPNYLHASLQGWKSVLLYGRTDDNCVGSIGASIQEIFLKKKLMPCQRAWDFLTISLSIIAADHGNSRKNSSDGWTRNFDLQIAVSEPEFWQTQITILQSLLRFLTTDIWNITFIPNGLEAPTASNVWRPENNEVILLSGGLDSLVGAINLISRGTVPFAVSQVVPVDSPNQKLFAQRLGLTNASYLQLNHCVKMPAPEAPPSDRARSIIFMAYGILLASCLQNYHDGQRIPLVVAENGLISMNPPLTAGRIGSLSTRTTHPYYIGLLQTLLNSAEIRVQIETPCQFYTKGEMLQQCRNQELLSRLATSSTSCGRFAITGRQHCGRCLPCLIRRAAFHAWQGHDDTSYKYINLSIQDKHHARFDDVQSAAMAVLKTESDGLDIWLGSALNSEHLGDIQPYREVIRKGIEELGCFLRHSRVI